MKNDFNDSNTGRTSPTVSDPLILRPGDDAFGPFVFDCSQSMPSGITISSVAVTAYKEGGQVANPTIIESDVSAPEVVGDASVQFNLQAPSGIDEGTYTVDIAITLSNNTVKHLAWGPIDVVAY